LSVQSAPLASSGAGELADSSCQGPNEKEMSSAPCRFIDVEQRHVSADPDKGMGVGRIVAGMILLGLFLAPQDAVNASGRISKFNIQAQTTCEAEMLANMSAHEVFSGNAYDVLAEVARAYRRPIPHIYVFPGSSNMAYIATSRAVDGRGKIVVGQQAIELFDASAFKGFLGHEMAHLVSDKRAQGCRDYIVRDPQAEADADALAARTVGTGPVKAFLQRVLILTQGENWEARQRLSVLQ